MVALQISPKIESLYGLGQYTGHKIVRVCMELNTLQLLQGSHLDDFPLKTLKLGWVPFLSFTF